MNNLLQDLPLITVVGIFSTGSFSNVIAAATGYRTAYEGGSFLTGSLFAIHVRNLSNREFDIPQVIVTSGQGNSAVHFSDSPVTDIRFLSEGKLSAGESAAIGYILDNDVADNTINMFYQFNDTETNRVFYRGGTFSFE